jgi:hypothetical protein
MFKTEKKGLERHRMELTTIVISISAAASIVAIVVGGIKVMQFVSERPKRDEVNEIIDRAVESLKNDVRYIRDRIDAVTEKVTEKKRK